MKPHKTYAKLRDELDAQLLLYRQFEREGNLNTEQGQHVADLIVALRYAVKVSWYREQGIPLHTPVKTFPADPIQMTGTLGYLKGTLAELHVNGSPRLMTIRSELLYFISGEWLDLFPEDRDE